MNTAEPCETVLYSGKISQQMQTHRQPTLKATERIFALKRLPLLWLYRDTVLVQTNGGVSAGYGVDVPVLHPTERLCWRGLRQRG